MKFFKFFILHTYFYKHSNLLKTRFFNALLFLLITCCIPAITFSLEKDQLEERFKKLSNELRCPTCQGLAVKDSEAGFSTSIKGKIRELIEKAKSAIQRDKKEIEAQQTLDSLREKVKIEEINLETSQTT